MILDRPNKFVDTVFECCDTGVRQDVFQIIFEDEKIDGKSITIDGKKLVNFGSCGYLGLELDPRLIDGAIDAARRYGVQYSSSRAYSACPLYREAEELLSKIFDNNPAVLAATTTLTHVGVLPILLQENDLIILDQKVHGSVQMACQLLKARGTQLEMIRHNNMQMLEEKINENPNKYEQIWYMADGIYSMFGDVAPIDDLIYLLDKYENFYLYIDDAHGMSWTGKNGRGYVMQNRPLHPKIVLTTSLAKGFGVGGGVFVMSNQEMKRKIFTCGTSYTFSGPIQPPLLGAIIESAKIHLSDEIDVLQNNLKEKIDYTRRLGQELKLPEVNPSESPIFYYALGHPRVGYSMIKKLMNEGYYTNIGIFPTVPVNCTGLRIPVTLNQSNEDIKNVLQAFAYYLPKVLDEQNVSIEQICRSFKSPFEETKKQYFNVAKIKEAKSEFTVQHETSVLNIKKSIWNNLLGDNGSFDWEGCKFIEETFSNNAEEENNWDLHYVVIKDSKNIPVLATFFTVAISKDDMVSTVAVSQAVEEKRKNDKYYLTSKVVSLGSLITEGNHIYIDRANENWKRALQELIKIMSNVKQNTEASVIQLRDFDTDDNEIKELLLNEGFIRFDLPDAHVVSISDWLTPDDYVESLSKKSRYHVRKNMVKNEDVFDVEIENVSNLDNIDDIYNLYLNIKRESFKINTFDLPKKIFKNALLNKNWELIKLRLKNEKDLCCFVLCYKSVNMNYCPIVIGIDYAVNETHSCYRQALYQIMKQSIANKCRLVYFGMDASIEKQKLGAKVLKKSMFLQADDNYSFEATSFLAQKK
ncbi:MAG: aminotransferase class I/II-fold pyridoxal phosphate-dependent enzyme [Bacteroidales bacterium]|nr:aminotransferase class I/II-fold pyridoxal phosphate-dependent enzyme [Bacteroidales bacterium]